MVSQPDDIGAGAGFDLGLYVRRNEGVAIAHARPSGGKPKAVIGNGIAHPARGGKACRAEPQECTVRRQRGRPDRWAIVASLIETAKLNGIEPSRGCAMH